MRNYAMTIALALTVAGAAVAEPAQTSQPTQFKVRIENISSPTAIKALGGKRQGVGLSPGFWVVHTAGDPVFVPGTYDRGKGLQQQAEDGNPGRLFAMVTPPDGMRTASMASGSGIVATGVFNTPVGASAPGPIGPGGTYEFTVAGTRGERLSATWMFGKTNDWFFALPSNGIALFDKKGQPIHGDLTKQVSLWDAGTEVSEEPGVGPNQGPQAADGVGPKEHNLIATPDNEFPHPGVAQILRITIIPVDNASTM